MRPSSEQYAKARRIAARLAPLTPNKRREADVRWVAAVIAESENGRPAKTSKSLHERIYG